MQIIINSYLQVLNQILIQLGILENLNLHQQINPKQRQVIKERKIEAQHLNIHYSIQIQLEKATSDKIEEMIRMGEKN
ncbi:unnamed protein product [Paramecium sonneborni]|uniref:Uncharacterized protein n=1 Tax=Paramecium sonneborni TaxID=65129 RepID=A0A8S1QXR5_9CILI|nr:unnamed protein product [Paramecium sonneborni]